MKTKFTESQKRQSGGRTVINITVDESKRATKVVSAAIFYGQPCESGRGRRAAEEEEKEAMNMNELSNTGEFQLLF